MKSDSIEDGSLKKQSWGVNRGSSVFDFVLRIFCFISTLTAAILMVSSSQTLPFSSRFFHYRATYVNIGAFKLFVVANGLVSGYLLQSLALSIFHILKTRAQKSRIVLIIFDVAMLGVLTSAACAATAVIALAHTGSGDANWAPVCQQFNYFCEKISGSLVGSFVGVVVLMALVINTAVALSRC